MSNEDQMEFKIGEDEQPANIEVNDETGEATIQEKEEPPVVEQEPVEAKTQEKELDSYSDNVKKRIDKLTARLRETQRREEAALEYAKNVQKQLDDAKQRYVASDTQRMAESRSRIETQSVALKQIIRKAREEGDVDTEVEAQERLAQIAYEQRQLQDYEARAKAQMEQAAQQQPTPVPQQPRRLDPRAEQWAEENSWFGKDTVMTHAAWGIHRELVQNEGVDPQSDEYYDELNRRIRETFPQKFAQSSQNSRSTRSAQAVAPANRSSGVNSARRTVRLTPSQVAIAKKLGVPLEEYAKYVKE